MPDASIYNNKTAWRTCREAVLLQYSEHKAIVSGMHIRECALNGYPTCMRAWIASSASHWVLIVHEAPSVRFTYIYTRLQYIIMLHFGITTTQHAKKLSLSWIRSLYFNTACEAGALNSGLPRSSVSGILGILHSNVWDNKISRTSNTNSSLLHHHLVTPQPMCTRKMKP